MDWTVLLAAKDAEKGIQGKGYSRTDPQDQFRIVTEPVGPLVYLFNVAFTGQNRDYGLASAFSIIIFLIVAIIAVVSFSRTKALEEIQR